MQFRETKLVAVLIAIKQKCFAHPPIYNINNHHQNNKKEIQDVDSIVK